MPIIRIDYDIDQIDEGRVRELSIAIQQIVSSATNIEDVFVYANSSEIRVKVAPIEIFVEMSAHIMDNEELMMSEIKTQLVERKKFNNFSYPINLTLIPMKRKIEIGI